jgi:hypothetical protein
MGPNRGEISNLSTALTYSDVCLELKTHYFRSGGRRKILDGIGKKRTHPEKIRAARTGRRGKVKKVSGVRQNRRSISIGGRYLGDVSAAIIATPDRSAHRLNYTVTPINNLYRYHKTI